MTRGSRNTERSWLSQSSDQISSRAKAQSSTTINNWILMVSPLFRSSTFLALLNNFHFSLVPKPNWVVPTIVIEHPTNDIVDGSQTCQVSESQEQKKCIGDILKS